MKWLKSIIPNIFFFVLIALLIIPQTGTPIKVFVQQLIARTPSIENTENSSKVNFTKWKILSKENTPITPLENIQKPIIINFWATWCPPCIAEMPFFSDIYEEYKHKINFYFVTNDDWETINTFENKRKFQLPYYRNIENHPQWEVRSIPRTIIINKKGEITIDETGVAKWNSDDFKNYLKSLTQ